ncbi:hypothetical protein GCM10027451_36080 [Geodermatophilus aquaeductus]|uniref:Uncharacterized protein n=1 Tax=Geodermatophilus aquaeductus TaxID=1564161 RepID=A0A521FT84_9ACTN|nr:hypothetical protein [Geodermatophilus aquaeductus]SMO98711.1 hypothetical protein SAMN06273567_1149 [Geodermatophilus aquaeductus]
MSDPGVWYARHTAPDGAAVLVGVLGTQFPADAVVELPWPPAHPEGWQGEAHVPAPGLPPSRVTLAPDVAPGAPHLWTVLLPAGDGDQVDLVTFSTRDFGDGAVVGRADFEALGIAWSNQVGALRWSPSTGVVAQLYVAPRFRRLGVAVKLFCLAAGIRAVLGWAPLTTDGRFTDLGEAWLRGTPAYWQRPVRRAWLPPMTPPGDTVGVPERNLVPDPA